MRLHNLLGAASAFALFSLVAASDVIDLTGDDFDKIVKPEELMLVEFFAPWCGHCKALAPHYEEAAATLKDKGIKIAKVDCVDQAELCQANGITGYPTLRVYRNGEHSDYGGERNTEGIVTYMVKQSLPAVFEVAKDDFHGFKTADRIVALLLADSTTEAPAPEYSAYAQKHRDSYLFGITADKEVIEAAGVKPPALVVYREFDEPTVEYPYPLSGFTQEDFDTWMKEIAVPVIDQVSGENYQVYVESGKPLAYIFLDPSDKEVLEETIASFKPVAAKFRGKVNFVWIDAIKFGDHAKALNLGEPKWPSFVIQNIKKQLKYPLDQSIETTPEAAEELVQKFVEGKVEPSLKSEPIPETQEEPVFVLVEKQFDEIIFDDSKDVLVEFYAPWCGHCKRLKPIYDDLGTHFADHKDKLVIAKMDATENDLPPSAPFSIAGFPTIKFKKAGTKDFIDYDGDRSLESLIAFVEENAANKIEKKVVTDEKPAAQEPIATPVASEKAEAHHHEHEHDEL